MLLFCLNDLFSTQRTNLQQALILLPYGLNLEIMLQIYAEKGQNSLPDFEVNTKLNDPALYRPSKELVDAVNVALALGQPLLLTGEPGTGKTQLAYHIAHFFQLGEPLVFNTQTTSSATDLFYKYDALSHFQYSQNNPNVLDRTAIEKQFIHYQGLGAAIIANSRKVVLIDEIDKAPRDLPNDVLAAIERLEFWVSEIGKSYKTTDKNRPIIIMTSNSEKNLPEAFLRRVVYYHIPFPDAATLLMILQSKIDAYDTKQLEQIISHFEWVRQNRHFKLKKNPATAELIFWTMLLQKTNMDIARLVEVKKMNRTEKQQLMMTYSVLAKNKEDLESLRTFLLGKLRR